MWIYSSGFPKSQDIGRSIQRGLGVEEYEEIIDTTKNSGFGQMDVARSKVGQEWSTKETEVGKARVTDPTAQKWEGWGTALKPAHEPIALARKPLGKNLSIAKNCQQWGTGALNIDATRIPSEPLTYPANGMNRVTFNQSEPHKWEGDTVTNELGRFPSNVLGEILQADYQKYFYCPKVSRKERHLGHETPPAMFGGVQGCYDENGERYAVGLDSRTDLNKGNNHPTVKPIELMKYLIKLITPPGGIVLDPFNGSGSTGCAAVELGYDYVGCELDPAYVEISLKRIEAWTRDDVLFRELFKEE
jgi:site-specific DNA-methyltransferase (adenine-specific)